MKTSKFDKILTKEFLEQEYIVNKKNTNEIANIIGCSGRTVCLYLKKNKIKTRDLKKENNPNWIDGKWYKKYKCIEPKCNNLVCSITHFKGQGRCSDCAHKGNRNSGFKDGRTLKKYYCKEPSCNNEIHPHTFLYGNRICGSCSIKYAWKIGLLDMKGQKSPNYIDGTGNDPYPSEFGYALKNKIRDRDNYTCQGENCGMTEEEHLSVYGRVLEVHHIDYNKENCNKENLITLCKQCNIRANKNRNFWQEYYKRRLLTCNFV